MISFYIIQFTYHEWLFKNFCSTSCFSPRPSPDCMLDSRSQGLTVGPPGAELLTDGPQPSAALRPVVYYMDTGAAGWGWMKNRLNTLVHLFIKSRHFFFFPFAAVAIHVCRQNSQNGDKAHFVVWWKKSLIYPLFCCHSVPPGRCFTIYQIKIMHFEVFFHVSLQWITGLMVAHIHLISFLLACVLALSAALINVVVWGFWGYWNSCLTLFNATRVIRRFDCCSDISPLECTPGPRL